MGEVPVRRFPTQARAVELQEARRLSARPAPGGCVMGGHDDIWRDQGIQRLLLSVRRASAICVLQIARGASREEAPRRVPYVHLAWRAPMALEKQQVDGS